MALNRTPEEILQQLPPQLVNNDVRVLGASSAETFTAPAGAYAVIFSGTSGLGDYWVQFRTGVTAAIPAADVTDGSAPALNPVGARSVYAGQTFSVIAANAGILEACWLGKPSYSG